MSSVKVLDATLLSRESLDSQASYVADKKGALKSYNLSLVSDDKTYAQWVMLLHSIHPYYGERSLSNISLTYEYPRSEEYPADRLYLVVNKELSVVEDIYYKESVGTSFKLHKVKKPVERMQILSTQESSSPSSPVGFLNIIWGDTTNGHYISTNSSMTMSKAQLVYIGCPIIEEVAPKIVHPEWDEM